MGDLFTSLPYTLQMQILQYPEKHFGELLRLDVQCPLLPHKGAHQDNTTAFNKLSRKLQLNCICDHLTKQLLSDGVIKPKGGSQLFPLEPIGIFMGAENYCRK
jgi:hypothetical protein